MSIADIAAEYEQENHVCYIQLQNMNLSDTSVYTDHPYGLSRDNELNGYSTDPYLDKHPVEFRKRWYPETYALYFRTNESYSIDADTNIMFTTYGSEDWVVE